MFQYCLKTGGPDEKDEHDFQNVILKLHTVFAAQVVANAYSVSQSDH